MSSLPYLTLMTVVTAVSMALLSSALLVWLRWTLLVRKRRETLSSCRRLLLLAWGIAAALWKAECKSLEV